MEKETLKKSHSEVGGQRISEACQESRQKRG